MAKAMTMKRRGVKRAARPLSLYELAGPLPIPTGEIARKCKANADAWVRRDDARIAAEVASAPAQPAA